MSRFFVILTFSLVVIFYSQINHEQEIVEHTQAALDAIERGRNNPLAIEQWLLREREPKSPPENPYLSDFNYMLNILYSGFPYFGIAERRYGINVDELINNTREALTDSFLDSDLFRQIVTINFTEPLNSIGHLRIESPEMIHLILANAIRGPVGYNGEYFDLGDREFSYWGELFTSVARSDAAKKYYGDIIIDLGNYESGMFLPNNLHMKIIENNIAYVRVERFWQYNIENDKERLFAFYQEISDFEHLIIDLRGNPGGFTRYFVQLFMSPNIQNDLEFYINSLFKGGENNMRWVEADVNDSILLHGRKREIFTVNTYDFTHINLDDLAVLDYISPHHVKITSSGQNFFGGKIWLLVDANSASAVEYAALYSRASDFATIVGEPTRGLTGGGLAGFFVMPNTGLIVRYDIGYFIDSYGRAVDEFGVIPDIFNYDGMDALETVVYVIKQNGGN